MSNKSNKTNDKQYPPSVRFYGPKEGQYGEYYGGETLRGNKVQELIDEINKANELSGGNGVSFFLNIVASDQDNSPAFRLKVNPGKAPKQRSEDL